MTDQKNGPRADADNLLEEGGQREEKFSSRDEFYEIKVEGHLDEGWSEWLSGLAVTHDDEGTLCSPGSYQTKLLCTASW